MKGLLADKLRQHWKSPSVCTSRRCVWRHRWREAPIRRCLSSLSPITYSAVAGSTLCCVCCWSRCQSGELLTHSVDLRSSSVANTKHSITRYTRRLPTLTDCKPKDSVFEFPRAGGARRAVESPSSLLNRRRFSHIVSDVRPEGTHPRCSWH